MKSVEKAIMDVKKSLGANGRVLVRYSGTEKMCRVMIEGEDLNKVEKYAQIIVNEIKNEIGD